MLKNRLRKLERGHPGQGGPDALMIYLQILDIDGSSERVLHSVSVFNPHRRFTKADDESEGGLLARAMLEFPDQIDLADVPDHILNEALSELRASRDTHPDYLA